MNEPKVVRNSIIITYKDFYWGLPYIKDKLRKIKDSTERTFEAQGWELYDKYETFNDQPDSWSCGLFYNTEARTPQKVEDCFGPFKYTYTIVGKE